MFCPNPSEYDREGSATPKDPRWETSKPLTQTSLQQNTMDWNSGADLPSAGQPSGRNEGGRGPEPPECVSLSTNDVAREATTGCYETGAQLPYKGSAAPSEPSVIAQAASPFQKRNALDNGRSSDKSTAWAMKSRNQSGEYNLLLVTRWTLRRTQPTVRW